MNKSDTNDQIIIDDSKNTPSDINLLDKLIELFKLQNYSQGIQLIESNNVILYLPNLYYSFIERLDDQPDIKIKKHISTLKILCSNTLSIHSIINIKNIVSKLLSKYKK